MSREQKHLLRTIEALSGCRHWYPGYCFDYMVRTVRKMEVAALSDRSFRRSRNMWALLVLARGWECRRRCSRPAGLMFSPLRARPWV